MRRIWSLVAVAALISYVGCDQPRGTTTPPPDRKVDVNTDPHTGDTGVEIKTPRRDIDIKAGPGGVDVDVDRDPVDPDRAKKVDVDVVPGEGVKVDVDK